MMQNSVFLREMQLLERLLLNANSTGA